MNGKRMMVESQSAIATVAIPGRRDLHLQGARALLTEWRRNTWAEHYRQRPWGMQCLLPDTILTTIATKARLRTVDDLMTTGWSPTHAKKHGAALLEILGEYDTNYHRTHEAEKSRRNEEKKRATAERQRARKEENARAREIRAAQPKPSRPSRARVPRQPLINSSILNHPPIDVTQYVVPSMPRQEEVSPTQHTHHFQPQFPLPYHNHTYPVNPYYIPSPSWPPCYIPNLTYPLSMSPHTPMQSSPPRLSPNTTYDNIYHTRDPQR
ncbi:hypothetical protein BD779DRAFT_1529416 [Infundibulicybe gibba]|nr:hypothetical protein BD779DRAFT_1529416 [Infundibulicybe gibba]